MVLRRPLTVVLVVIALLAALARVATPANAHHGPTGYIHADGTHLVDGAGNPFFVRGVQMECWLTGGGLCWGGGIATETAVYGALRGLVGQDATAAFRNNVYNAYVTEPDVARAAHLGVNVLRIAINHTAFDAGGQFGWGPLDNLVGWANHYDIHVLLELHAAPSPQSKALNADYTAGEPTLWDPGGRVADTVALWQRIAARYADNKAVAGYELLNEPITNNQGGDLLALYQQTIAAIRGVDAHHLLVLDGDKATADLSFVPGRLDDNEAYAFHTYRLNDTGERNQLRYFQRYSSRDGVPILNTEFGLNTNSWVSSTRRRFEDPRNGVSGWVFWSWKGPYRGNSLSARTDTAHLIEQYVPTPAWDRVIAYASGVFGSLRPTPDATRTGMQQFIGTVDGLDHSTEPVGLLKALALHR